MRFGMRVAAAIVIAASACTPRVRPARAPSIAERLAAVAALLRAGCYDCLVTALGEARRLATISRLPEVQARVRDAAGLLAMRERVLGLVDQHYLDQARDAFAGRDDRWLVDVIATLPRRYAGAGRAADDEWIESFKAAARNRETWHAQLSALEGADPLAAATAISFECAHNANRTGPELAPILDRSGGWKDSPLLRFTAALCVSFEPAPLAELADADPRFAEVGYFLGVAATLKGDLEEADRRFGAAFAWRQDWPAAAIAVANLAMTSEDFDRAVDFYDRTLTLLPGSPDAMLGRVRALTFAGKYAEAIATADDLLSTRRWYVGDALYWRAWNEMQLDRDEAAWTDVHEAARLVVNAEVPKLTGLLAVRRRAGAPAPRPAAALNACRSAATFAPAALRRPSKPSPYTRLCAANCRDRAVRLLHRTSTSCACSSGGE